MADQGTLTAPAVIEHPSLMVALCAAQAEFDPVIKAHTNTHLKSKYATLDAVLAAVRPALNRHGLALIQPPRMEEDLLVVDTTIIHASSGERLACTYPVKNLGDSHQAMGAALTYARRFSLTALLGVFPEDEDEDGEGAGDTGKRAPPEQRQPDQFRKPDKTAYSARKDGGWERLQDALNACKTIGDVDDFMRSDEAQRVPYQWRESLRDAAETRRQAIGDADDFPGDQPAPVDFEGLKRDLLDCGTKETFLEIGEALKAAIPSLTTEQRAELKALHADAKARVSK